jgi:hypothetical protein
VAHLLRLERVLGRLNGHVLLAIDLDAVCDDGLGLALVVERGGNGAHLSGGELQPVSAVLSHATNPLAHTVACCYVRYARVAGGRTEKSGDEAQVVWPLTSQMRALSMLPVPTRLQRARVREASSCWLDSTVPLINVCWRDS